ncbi:MAG: hypothetical protein NVSMB64_08740 [Candidatus Velthaea sp.]
MKRLLQTAAFGTLMCALEIAPALAADQMDHGAMAGPALTCVPAASSNTASAVAKLDGHDVMLECKPTQMMMGEPKLIGKVAAKTGRTFGPNVDTLLTPGDIDAAWAKWTAEMLHMTGLHLGGA